MKARPSPGPPGLEGLWSAAAVRHRVAEIRKQCEAAKTAAKKTVEASQYRVEEARHQIDCTKDVICRLRELANRTAKRS